MKRLIPLAALFLMGCSGMGAPARAGMLCVPHDDMAKNLAENHNERPVSMGLDNSGVMIEVFAAPAGNWTIVMTQPGGMACLMAAGGDWTTILPKQPGDSL